MTNIKKSAKRMFVAKQCPPKHKFNIVSVNLHTWRQSSAVTTILAALLWHANSNGRKYFSAVMTLASSFFGNGKADDEFGPSWPPSFSSFRISSTQDNHHLRLWQLVNLTKSWYVWTKFDMDIQNWIWYAVQLSKIWPSAIVLNTSARTVIFFT